MGKVGMGVRAAEAEHPVRPVRHSPRPRHGARLLERGGPRHPSPPPPARSLDGQFRRRNCVSSRHTGPRFTSFTRRINHFAWSDPAFAPGIRPRHSAHCGQRSMSMSNTRFNNRGGWQPAGLDATTGCQMQNRPHTCRISGRKARSRGEMYIQKGRKYSSFIEFLPFVCGRSCVRSLSGQSPTNS
jgi:hypothetical protein